MSITDLPLYLISEIYSYIGPSPELGQTCKVMREMHNQALCLQGMVLARSISPDLWNPNAHERENKDVFRHSTVQLPLGHITNEQGRQIVRIALDTVRYALTILSLKERAQFSSYPQLQVCTNPQLFTQIIRILDIRSLFRLLSIPPHRNSVKKLTATNLTDKSLAHIPLAIKRLPNLRDVNLSKNHFTTIPSSIIQIITLSFLDLTHNRLVEIPTALFSHASLQKLDLSDNPIETFPEVPEQALPKLEWLSLSRDQLSSLPPSFSRLTALKKLLLSGNKFTTIPEVVCQCPSLERLNISGNNLISVPESLLTLNLRSLFIHGNRALVNDGKTKQTLDSLRRKNCEIRIDQENGREIEYGEEPQVGCLCKKFRWLCCC